MTPGFDKQLYVLPFDHRGSFQTKMFGWKGTLNADQTAEISNAKRVIYHGYRAAAADGARQLTSRSLLKPHPTGGACMKIDVYADPDIAARAAAKIIAAEAREAVGLRGQFTVAFSGGHTPWIMLRALADGEVPWDKVHIFQVDERMAAAGDRDRNLTHLRECLLDRVPVRPDHVHAMPVEEPDLNAAAARYAQTLLSVAGSPPVLDLVHLGLGPDGHTASLVPGDPALEISSAGVAVTGAYQGHPRMTLTYPILNRSRRILWLVTGGEKAGMLLRLFNGDPLIPAGRLRQEAALVIADRAAAEQLGAAGLEAKM